MKILTFNHHESYLTLLAKTGFEFDVVIRYRNLDLAWSPRQNTAPANFRLIEFDDQVRQDLKNGKYDVVIAHTLKNLLWLFFYFKPVYIFVAHIPLFRYSWTLRCKSFFKKICFQLFALTHKVRFHAVSTFKQQSWGIPGTVSVLSPQVFAPAKNLNLGEVVLVCNNLLQRQKELGYELIKTIRQQIPVKIIGHNPGLENGFTPKDFAEFQKHFSSATIYLYTIAQPYGDGYNTAMLEAMQLGMVVVSIDNPSSPIVHGQNGLFGKNAEEIIRHLDKLRKDPALVERLGQNARATIEEKFSQTQFINSWQELINLAAASSSS